jgi:hypothetical protein
MLLGERDLIVKQEQYQDQMRDVAKYRLIREAKRAANQEAEAKRLANGLGVYAARYRRWLTGAGQVLHGVNRAVRTATAVVIAMLAR